MTTDDRTIYQRIADAKRDLASADFTKSNTVKAGGGASYRFIPLDQILLAVRKVQADHGIMCFFGVP